MSDVIFIRGLVVHAHHGVMPHETKVGQRFVIDLELSVDLSGPSRTDRLADTVSYADIVETATGALCRPELPAGRARCRRRHRSDPVEISAHHDRDHFRSQAARADRRDLRRCRRQADALKDLSVADALVALGGNVGDVRETFRRAILDVCARANAKLLARSSDYRTPPWGDTQQPDFINACIRIETELKPLELLGVLQAVETAFGRNRAAGHRYGPRTLDLDLLAYDDLAMATPELELPHPRLFERAFVLVPLAEIAPDRPIGGRTPAAALKLVSREGIDRLPDSAAP